MWTKLLIIAAASALVACGGTTQKKSAGQGVETTDMHTAENSLDYQGLYKGTIPAADCPGIEVTLRLKADDTFEEHYKYLERDSQFDRTGNYTVEGNILTLLGDTPSYLKIGENHLRMLDAQQQEITGPLAENYVLTKTE